MGLIKQTTLRDHKDDVYALLMDLLDRRSTKDTRSSLNWGHIDWHRSRQQTSSLIETGAYSTDL